MINERKLYYGEGEKRDLLSNLISANDEFLDDGEQRLGEVELIGTGLGLGLPARLSKYVRFRKHVHVLHCWTRGEDCLTGAEDHLISAA